MVCVLIENSFGRSGRIIPSRFLSPIRQNQVVEAERVFRDAAIEPGKPLAALTENVRSTTNRTHRWRVEVVAGSNSDKPWISSLQTIS